MAHPIDAPRFYIGLLANTKKYSGILTAQEIWFQTVYEHEMLRLRYLIQLRNRRNGSL